MIGCLGNAPLSGWAFAPDWPEVHLPRHRLAKHLFRKTSLAKRGFFTSEHDDDLHVLGGRGAWQFRSTSLDPGTGRRLTRYREAPPGVVALSSSAYPTFSSWPAPMTRTRVAPSEHIETIPQRGCAPRRAGRPHDRRDEAGRRLVRGDGGQKRLGRVAAKTLAGFPEPLTERHGAFAPYWSAALA
jgi:hypothetical protein